MDLYTSMAVSASGMKAQGTRLKTIAENLANANTTAETPGDLPYRRKVVMFQNALDRQMGVDLVRVAKIDVDKKDFERRYDPSHPSADADGYVLLPNVNSVVEAMDMREAQRSYEANLSAVDSARQMLMRTIDILRT
ncbi:flagellar basal body rod protein FlgC [Azospirillum brasilense]|jgi:flagellar basal-body rod protein FlgC|uniref:Flagellar basal-body rod protein FlgC n=3 Tax=Azospirillum TaxID=191 RepID=A0A4D8QNC8_AZOBR|nr:MULTISPECIES: flagellar basal body rod protein FlgC [Azospirillum]AIB11185.1 flagellar basal-body rod protein FlgC [Azospirillum argentinense]ALJ35737.1 flagellar basal-body rod protein FlgC [Azospirillum brasilense]EZQ08133.1 flagellar basal-body rod protein FlgC [Azospirillum argentinense]KAA1058481.1 Flagellar basal-body rod protein FlgC [Azospirillum argentinense]MBK3776690.1 flagellar basal body rod protein FlgC [Azospirillum brasilense]